MTDSDQSFSPGGDQPATVADMQREAPANPPPPPAPVAPRANGNGKPPADARQAEAQYQARQSGRDATQWEQQAKEAIARADAATEQANAVTHRALIAETASDLGLSKKERGLLSRMAPVGATEEQIAAAAKEIADWREEVTGSVKQSAASELDAYKAQQAAQMKNKSMQARPFPVASEPPPDIDYASVMADPAKALAALEKHGLQGGFIQQTE